MGGDLNLSVCPFGAKSYLIYPQKQNMSWKSVPHPLNTEVNTEYYQSENGNVSCNPSKWLWPAIGFILPVFNLNCLFQFHSCWREIGTSRHVGEVLSLRAGFSLLLTKELRSSAEVKCLTLSSSSVRWSPAVQSHSSLQSHMPTQTFHVLLTSKDITLFWIYLFFFFFLRWRLLLCLQRAARVFFVKNKKKSFPCILSA